MNQISISNISKSFGDTRALNNISLVLKPNKIYGLLGRNGAGKTTLLNLISNRLFADSGEITIDELHSRENDAAQRKLYFMSEATLYPEKMKIMSIYKWTKEFYKDFDIEYAKALSDMFKLDVNKNVKSLSTGYASIFKVIVALSVNTPYIFLDEPVLGLDANHRDLFYRVLLEKYNSSPCTIVISTHLIEEVAGIIEDVIIIKDGSILLTSECDKLLALGYTISGTAEQVDSYITKKAITASTDILSADGTIRENTLIGTDSLGGLKTAYIVGKIDEELSKELTVSKLDLQKLFIQLTNA